MDRPTLNKLLQYTRQRANLERNYNENAQNINYASILINPEIPGLAEPQSRGLNPGISGLEKRSISSVANPTGGEHRIELISIQCLPPVGSVASRSSK